MSLIFDRFPSRQQAENFVAAITSEFNVEGEVFDDQETSNQADPFPFALNAPIALIDRPVGNPKQAQIEGFIIKRVRRFGGVFAGT
jgi:hypothetical protein